MTESVEVAVIGAGPSGAVAAALLKRLGHQVVVLERSHFPRFSIGESLLPQCMEFLAEAGMLDAVNRENFQYKNGAAFVRDGKRGSFDFRDKFSPGAGTTFQVQRARFDKVLADEAERQGVDIRYGHQIHGLAIDQSGHSTIDVVDEQRGAFQIKAQFVLDASGFGRVLPRLLDLDTPSDFPERRSVFTHVEDRISAADHDREKILIAIHPQRADVWYWLIPFANGRCSLGVVAEKGYFEQFAGAEYEAVLRDAVAQCPDLDQLLSAAQYDTAVQCINGYSANVKALSGPGFALLGNAGEFLDPVFSSGVTIALKSASLAAPLVSRHLRGEAVDWQAEYARQLMVGINTFRAYVNGWYEGSFQHIVFASNQTPQIRAMISSILAGYAWDSDNPFVQEPQRRLQALAELCKA